MAPYHRDRHDDHEQTNQIAQEAIARVATGIPLFEYPVWAWHQWPWCPLHLGSRRDVIHELPAALRANLNLIGDLDTCVDVRPVQALKSRALSAYKTQMTRVIDTPRWLTLADVSGGEFLANLLRDREFYSRVEPS
jgi:LmbE family N-acetylglucosaminyl deacetylase